MKSIFALTVVLLALSYPTPIASATCTDPCAYSQDFTLDQGGWTGAWNPAGGNPGGGIHGTAASVNLDHAYANAVWSFDLKPDAAGAHWRFELQEATGRGWIVQQDGDEMRLCSRVQQTPGSCSAPIVIGSATLSGTYDWVTYHVAITEEVSGATARARVSILGTAVSETDPVQGFSAGGTQRYTRMSLYSLGPWVDLTIDNVYFGPPPADPCTDSPHGNCYAQRLTLASDNGYDSRSTQGASTQPGEPAWCSNIGATLWYDWIAPTTGSYVIDTSGSSFDTVVVAHTGTALATLAYEACSDDGHNGDTDARLVHGFQGGRAYRIQVGGAGGDFGQLQVRVYAGT